MCADYKVELRALGDDKNITVNTLASYLKISYTSAEDLLCRIPVVVLSTEYLGTARELQYKISQVGAEAIILDSNNNPIPINQYDDDDEGRVFKELFALNVSGRQEEALKLLQKYSSPDRFSVFDLMLAKNYLRLGRYQEALDTLKRSATNLFPTSDYRAAALLSFDKGRAELGLGMGAEARKDFLFAQNIAQDLRYEDRALGINGFIKDLSRAYFDRANEEYCKSFLSLPYYQRKAIIIVRDITSLETNHVAVFQINHCPKISFPISHPVPNQVYIGHPYTPNIYIPFESYELSLVEDRIREFCLLSQSLGATEISIDAVNSSESEHNQESHSKIMGDVGYKLISADASHNGKGSQRLLEAISKSISIHQEFTPSFPPHLPEDLVWYPSEPSWQRLYEQRMKGQDIHVERIETRRSQVIGGTELEEIKAEVKALVLSVDGEWTKNMEENFIQQENAILSIKVKFAPLAQLTGKKPRSAQASLSSDEQDYLEMYKEYATAGEISALNRKMLNKYRSRLGISEERARELEESCSKPQLTEDEQEYLEMYKEYAADGEISERDRKMLNKMRDRMGISEERSKEIEKI